MFASRRTILSQVFLAATALPIAGATSDATADETLKYSGKLVVDVRAYGAKGNGSTNDFAAVQTAIEAVAHRNAAQGAGGIVYFPAGIYALNSALTIPKNIYLVGESPIASRLLYFGSRTDAFLTFGTPGNIATFSGIRGMWIDAKGNATTTIRMYGPQEGSEIAETIATGGRHTVIQVLSDGIQGGSNKFVIDRCWLWTEGDGGNAGILIGPHSGPLSIRDSTVVGVNRTRKPPANSAGVVATDSLITLDNVNVEHFENHSYLTRTQADLRAPTGFFNTNGVKTSRDSTGTTLTVSNATFDQAKNCIVDQGSGVTLRYARSYWNEAYSHDRRNFRRNFWEVGSANVYQSASQQATMGYTSPATSDTSRFKFSVLQPDGWKIAASIDAAGVFGSADSSYNGSHLRIGNYHLWVDSHGQLRMKNGPPTADTDGSLAGI